MIADRAAANLVQLLEPFGMLKIPGNESEAAVMMKIWRFVGMNGKKISEED